jgi:hypothetical protein
MPWSAEDVRLGERVAVRSASPGTERVSSAAHSGSA